MKTDSMLLESLAEFGGVVTNYHFRRVIAVGSVLLISLFSTGAVHSSALEIWNLAKRRYRNNLSGQESAPAKLLVVIYNIHSGAVSIPIWGCARVRRFKIFPRTPVFRQI